MINRCMWNNILQKISSLMIENKQVLSDIDARFGDGDHGITIEKIAMVLKNETDKWVNTDKTLKDLFSSIGNGVMNVSGGSAGPLYGTYFCGLGECLKDEVEVDACLLKKIFKSGLTKLQYITNAKVGDKTMMDTLIPATEAVEKASDDINAIVTAGKDAALQGAKNSENFVSKFGRARMYKEQTIGVPDAGAVSCTYIFLGFYQALIDNKEENV